MADTLSTRYGVIADSSARASTPKIGELTLQNWNEPGNHYLFLGKGEFSKYDWRGGINYTTIKEAESHSIRYHESFKVQSQQPLELTGKYLKTCNRVSRFPYARDGRRSVGVGVFYCGRATRLASLYLM